MAVVPNAEENVELLDEGYIVETADRPDDDDPRRRYYQLTDEGAEALQAEAQRMEALAARRGELPDLPAACSTRARPPTAG